MRQKLFKNLTKQEKIVLWLKYRGYKEVESRTNKAIAMQHPDKIYAGKTITYFISKNGFMRRSWNNKLSDSSSCQPNEQAFKAFCEEMEKKGDN